MHEHDAGAGLADGVEQGKGWAADIGDVEHEFGTIKRGVEALPAIDRGFGALARADIGEPLVSLGFGAVDQFGRGGDVVGAHIGHWRANRLAAADGDEGIVAVDQALQLSAVEFAPKDDAAISEAKAVVLMKDLALAARARRTGQQQQIVA